MLAIEEEKLTDSARTISKWQCCSLNMFKISVRDGQKSEIGYSFSHVVAREYALSRAPRAGDRRISITRVGQFGAA
jgi:hypothetical protein